jgi:mRNA interferase MazF
LSNKDRGEIWLVDFDPSTKPEQQKTRPALIVSDPNIGKLALKVVVPITDWKERYDNYAWMVRLDPTPSNGLSKVSSADTFQLKSVSLSRFRKFVGVVSMEDMAHVECAMKSVLSI